MITYIKFNNFYSYLDETKVSFMLGKQPTVTDYDFSVDTTKDTYRLNKVMAIVGANGSGKTQLLKAFAFLRFFICGSMDGLDSDEEIPYRKFALADTELSEFELGFLLKNSEGSLEAYRYELVLSNTDVISESLYKKTSRQFSYIFVREYDDNNQLIYKYRDFVVPSLANDVKKNASLISYAKLLDDPLAEAIIDMFNQYKTNVSAMGRSSSMGQSMVAMTELFHQDEKLKKTAENLLCQFDTGIHQININKVLIVNDEDKKSKEVYMPFGVHKAGDEEFELIFYEESNGTQSAYSLLGLILPVLKTGGVALIDELDNDLHPHLLPVLLDLFRSTYHNPHNAQLIFSCHTPEVFNLLNKHQIYLVEKFEQASEAWRLDEVEGVRNDDNLYAKYMAGAFDAVPNL